MITDFGCFCKKTKQDRSRPVLMQESKHKARINTLSALPQAEITKGLLCPAAGSAQPRMRFDYNKKDCLLTVFADGEIDQYSVDKIRKNIDMEIGRHNDLKRMLIDMKKVRFMDSTGVGLILGRYKLLCTKGAALSIRNASPAVDRLLRISGVYSVADER